MNLYITIIVLGLLIFFSHAFNELFDKTKIPRYANGEVILDLGFSIVLFSIVICSLLVIILSTKPDFFVKLRRKNNLTSEIVYENDPDLIIK